MRGERSRALLAVLAVLVGTAVTYPAWFTGTAYGFGDDVLEYSVPFASYFLDELRAGRFPLWNPFQDGGMPMLAQPPWMGPLYPGVVLFAWLPAGRALDAGFALHVLSFALGSYALARRRGIGRVPAVLAAWAVAAGTPMRTLFRMGYLPETVALSFLPWLLLLGDRALRERARWLPATAAAGLLLGAMHLGGHLVASGVVLLSLGLYVLALGVARTYAERDLRGVRDAISFLVGAELTGLAIAAPQIVALVSAGLESTLDGGRPVAADEYAYLEQAWRLGSFLFARFDPVAKGHLFVGTVLLVFLPFARRRVELLVLGVGSAVLLMGNATPVWTGLRAALPPLRIFSYFYFFIVPLGLAVALAAAHGLDRWLGALADPDVERRRAVGRPIGAMIVALLGVALVTLAATLLGSGPPVELARDGVVSSLPRSAALLALVGALAWGFARLERPRARARVRWVLGALVFLELAAHGVANPRIPELGRRAASAMHAPFDAARTFDRDAIVEELPAAGSGRVLRVERGRYAASWALARNEGLVQRYEDVERASKLPFARAVALTAALDEIDLDWGAALARSKQPARAGETLLRLTNGSTALRILDLLDVKAIATDGAVLGRGFARGPRVGAMRVYHRRGGPARVYAVTRWDRVDDLAAAVRATLDPARDPWSRPVEEGAPPSVAGAPSPEGMSVELGARRWEPGRISVEVRAPAPALVVLGEMAHRGWAVSVDGERVPPVIANGVHLAVVVPAGTHAVEAVYRPAGVVAGFCGSAIALLLALAVGRPFARLRVPPWRPGVPLWW